MVVPHPCADQPSIAAAIHPPISPRSLAPFRAPASVRHRNPNRASGCSRLQLLRWGHRKHLAPVRFERPQRVLPPDLHRGLPHHHGWQSRRADPWVDRCPLRRPLMVRLLNGWAVGFFRISVLVLVHTHGWQRSFQPVTKARIRLFSSGTETTSARCRAWRSMSPNHASCRRRTNTGQMRCWHLNQVQPRGRVRREAHLEPRVFRQPGSYLGGLVHGVVVHHQVQIPWR